ncbi:MAG: hypothetical protein AB1726_09020 [Planctomycetota bacterium]
MSPIGRIFIVLNLVLAAAFLGWAANALATTDNYRSQLDAKTAEFAELKRTKEDEISKLTTEMRAFENDGRTFREQRDGLQQQANLLETQLGEAKRDNEQMRADLTAIRSTLNDYNTTIQALNAQKDEAVAARREAEGQRDEAVAQAQEAQQLQRDAQDAQRTAEQQIADLEGERTDLRDQVSRLDTHLAMVLEKTGLTMQEVLTPPKIDAQVLSVRLDVAPGLVMLNVGAKQDVKRGYTFEIWRGGIYKGQVRVEDVQEDVCAALVLNAVSGTEITQGDRASTVL